MQGRKTEGCQHLPTTQEGRKVEGEEAREYIRWAIREAFPQFKQRGTVENTDSSRIQEEHTSITMEVAAREWD